MAIAVAEEARGDIYGIAAACRAHGLCHTATLIEVGVLTGSVRFHNLRKLWAIPGVIAVELEAGSQTQVMGEVHPPGAE